MAEQNTAEVLQDRPIPQDNAEELTPADADEAGDVDPQANANTHDDETEGRKRLGGWQRKIKKLEEQNETLIEALRKVGGNAQTTQAAETKPVEEDKPPVKPSRPKVTDFDDWNKYEVALEKFEADRDKYHEDNLAYQLRRQDAVRKQQAEKQTVVDGWAGKIAEAKQKYPDFAEVAFNNEIPLSEIAAQAIIRSDIGTEVAYYLGKHPDEAQSIFEMNAIDAVREIGKIESRIAGTKPAATEEAEDDEAHVAVSKAPKPPMPVRRATATNPDPSDSDDYKTWLRKREAQLRK